MAELKGNRDENEILDEALDAGADYSFDLVGTAEEVVERYCHCHLCGSNLHFTYSTDFAKNLSHETARCPECGIRARQLTHKLQ